MCGPDRTEVLPATWRRAAEGLDHLEHMTVDPCSDPEPGREPGDSLADTLFAPSSSAPRPRRRTISYDRALIPVQLPAHADFTRTRGGGAGTLSLAFAAIVSLTLAAVAFL